MITVGGVQSNHCRQTAAAAARLGLKCELILPHLSRFRSSTYDNSGNVLLDRLFGANLHITADMEAATVRTSRGARPGARSRRQGVFHSGRRIDRARCPRLCRCGWGIGCSGSRTGPSHRLRGRHHRQLHDACRSDRGFRRCRPSAGSRLAIRV